MSLAFGTGDDSVFCHLCDPPYETSIAMWVVHMEREHGWTDEDFEAVRNAPVVVDGESE